MVRRMNVIRAAAMGTLACAGVAGAAEVAAVGATSELRLDKPAYLQETEKGRKPLMSAIDRTGGATMLDDIGLDISGHVEAGYTYSFQQPPGDVLTGRVFDVQHDELLLNQAAIVFSRPLAATDDAVVGYKDKFNVGFKVDVMYGYDARFIHSNGLLDHYNDDVSRNEEWDLTQAYLEFGIPVGNGLLVTAGKFVTLLGAETINPTNNALYSHSYLFGFAIPFTHTGVMAKYSFSDSFNATVGVHRGWEQSTEDNNDRAVSLIGQIGYTWTPGGPDSEPVNLILSAVSGPEQADEQGNWRTVVDLVAETQVADQLTVAINADYAYEEEAALGGGQAQWYGVAAYAKYEIDKNGQFAINARGEWFNDKDGARGLGTNVYEATLGLAIKPFADTELGSNIVFRPEVRYDYAQEAIFDAGSQHDQFTVGADVIFAF